MNKIILKLAFPLILTNLTTPLLGFVNTLVVGHLSHSYYLGAVGLGAMIFNFLFLGFNFLRMGTTGLVSNAYGRSNYAEMLNIICHSMLVALVISLLLLIFQYPIERVFFHFIGGSEQIRFYTAQYYYIRIWAAPAAMLNLVLMGAYIGMQNTKVPLLVMSIVNIIAIILDVILVFKFDMAAQGVALADVIAQYIGLVVALLFLPYFFKGKKNLRVFSFQRKLFTSLCSANRDIFIRSFCLMGVFTFFNIQSTRLGVTILAVNTVLMNFQLITAYALDGFANAAEALVGQSIGAKDYKRFIKVVKYTMIWSLVMSLAFVIFYLIAGCLIINLMTSIDQVRRVAMLYLPFSVIAPIISVWCFAFDGIFIGANQFSQMRNTMLISVFGFIIVWYGLKSLGNSGLWISLLSFFFFRATTMGCVFLKKYKTSFISRSH